MTNHQAFTIAGIIMALMLALLAHISEGALKFTCGLLTAACVFGVVWVQGER